MKKLLLCSALVLSLAGCSEQQEVTPSNAVQTDKQQQSFQALPNLEVAQLEEVKLQNMEQYSGKLTEQQIKETLMNFPQVAHLSTFIAYIAETASNKLVSDIHNVQAYEWYAESMQDMHLYIEQLLREAKWSDVEKETMTALWTPWLAKIDEVSSDMLQKISDGAQGPELEPYEQDIHIIAVMLGSGLSFVQEQLYGAETVDKVTSAGLEQWYTLDKLMSSMQQSYEQFFDEEMTPYSVEASKAYLQMLSQIGDPPAGYLMDVPENEVSTPAQEDVTVHQIGGGETVELLENDTKIRRSPSIDAEIIYTGQKGEVLVYMGQAYETHADGRLWYEVSSMAGGGYVSSKVAKISTKPYVPYTGWQITITGIEVNVREHMDINSAVVAEVYKGDKLDWTGKRYPSEDGRLWYEVVIGEEVGYVSSKFVQEP